MISDSVPWKEELLRVAERLEDRRLQKKWIERTFFLVERDVMVAGYAIRKLLEAGRVSDEVSDIRVRVQTYALGARPPDVLSAVDFSKLYDLEKPTAGEITLQQLANQIIHSFVWTLSFEDRTRRFDGIYLASDVGSRKQLFFVDIREIIRVLKCIGSDDVVEVHYARDNAGAMRIVRASSRDSGLEDAPGPRIIEP